MERGYMGKMLRVDLTHRTVREEQLSEELCHKFIGGYGFGAKILYDEMPARVDPLGPLNMLGFFTGPLTGSPCIEGNRFQAVCKSPLTDSWGDANCGGTFGPNLKAAGFDGILFTGIADNPVFLNIENGKAELRDALDLWGLDTNETEDRLKKELGDPRHVQVLSIGPAGEKLSLIAGIINDYGRALARSGVGAVMGSKRLKAVTVKGTMTIPLYDQARSNALRKEYLKKHGGDYDFFTTTGTIGMLGSASRNGDSPIKNWGGVGEIDFPTGKSKFRADVVMSYQARKYGCWRCTMACGGHMEVKDPGPYHGVKHHKVEYESAGGFGSMTLNDNFPSLIYLNELCNRYGFDTISAGATTAFAIECYENGLITRADTDGLELTWGNHEAIVALVHKMGRREGIGDLFADGVRKAAERIGSAATPFAMHIHGQELPMHDPKFLPGLAITYLMDATPGRHTQGAACWFPPGLDVPSDFDQHDYGSYGELQRWMVCMLHTVQSAGVCRFGFTSYDYHLVPDFLTAVTGWDFGVDACILAGDRIGTLRHAFNLREGLSPVHYEMPGRVIGNPPKEAGPLKGITLDMDALVRSYLEAMGWDPDTGIPSQAKLQALGLNEVLNDLYPSRVLA